MVTTLLASLAASLCSAAGAAAASISSADEPRHARVSLIGEATGLVPGSTAYLGIHFEMDPKWHVYWRGQSDSGGPVNFSVTAPPGFTLGTAIWPAPKRYISEGEILDHVYEDRLTIIIPVEVPSSAAGATPAEFSAKVDYVICSAACVMEEAEASLKLPILATGPATPDARTAPAFAATRARAPRPVAESAGAVKATRSGSVVTVDAPGAVGLTFYPEADSAMFVNLLKDGQSDKPSLSMRVAEGDLQPVRGVVEVRFDKGKPTAWYDIDLPMTSPAAPAPAAPPKAK